MDYVEPAAARDMDGLRLALTAHAPAPYGLSARAILDHHGGYVPVLQVLARTKISCPGPDTATHPVAVYNDEAARERLRNPMDPDHPLFPRLTSAC